MEFSLQIRKVDPIVDSRRKHTKPTYLAALLACPALSSTNMPNAYIVTAVRSAGGKKNGRLREWHPISLGAAVLDALVERSGIDASLVDDVIVGCVSQVRGVSAQPQGGTFGVVLVASGCARSALWRPPPFCAPPFVWSLATNFCCNLYIYVLRPSELTGWRPGWQHRAQHGSCLVEDPRVCAGHVRGPSVRLVAAGDPLRCPGRDVGRAGRRHRRGGGAHDFGSHRIQRRGLIQGRSLVPF